MAYWASAYDVFPLLNLLRCLVTKKKESFIAACFGNAVSPVTQLLGLQCNVY